MFIGNSRHEIEVVSEQQSPGRQSEAQKKSSLPSSSTQGIASDRVLINGQSVVRSDGGNVTELSKSIARLHEEFQDTFHNTQSGIHKLSDVQTITQNLSKAVQKVRDELTKSATEHGIAVKTGSLPYDLSTLQSVIRRERGIIRKYEGNRPVRHIKRLFSQETHDAHAASNLWKNLDQQVKQLDQQVMTQLDKQFLRDRAWSAIPKAASETATKQNDPNWTKHISLPPEREAHEAPQLTSVAALLAKAPATAEDAEIHFERGESSRSIGESRQSDPAVDHIGSEALSKHEAEEVLQAALTTKLQSLAKPVASIKIQKRATKTLIAALTDSSHDRDPNKKLESVKLSDPALQELLNERNTIAAQLQNFHEQKALYSKLNMKKYTRSSKMNTLRKMIATVDQNLLEKLKNELIVLRNDSLLKTYKVTQLEMSQRPTEDDQKMLSQSLVKELLPKSLVVELVKRNTSTSEARAAISAVHEGIKKGYIAEEDVDSWIQQNSPINSALDDLAKSRATNDTLIENRKAILQSPAGLDKMADLLHEVFLSSDEKAPIETQQLLEAHFKTGAGGNPWLDSIPENLHEPAKGILRNIVAEWRQGIYYRSIPQSPHTPVPAPVDGKAIRSWQDCRAEVEHDANAQIRGLLKSSDHAHAIAANLDEALARQNWNQVSQGTSRLE